MMYTSTLLLGVSTAYVKAVSGTNVTFGVDSMEFDTTVAIGAVSKDVILSQGICAVTNSGIRSLCQYYKGASYDSVTRQCTYTAQYCQSIGMCYDLANKTCFLPTAAMTAASAFFGNEGPRQWIRVHGCTFGNLNGQYNSETLEAFVDLIPLGMFFTNTGKQFLSEIFMRYKS